MLLQQLIERFRGFAQRARIVPDARHRFIDFGQISQRLSLFHWAAPGSFAGLPADAGVHFDSSLVFFSFVTMTTLGYGDIVPASPAARSLATLQAVVGQLYLAVLVARLVGLHVAESVRRKD